MADDTRQPHVDGSRSGGSSTDAGPSVLDAADADALHVAGAALLVGGIVGLPTETVYGLAVLPRPAALRALIDAKRRTPDKGIPLLLDGLDQVAGLVVVTASAQRLAARFWPGPLTLVLPLLRARSLPEDLTGGRSSLAVRVPDHPVPRALARELGPLAVTSANLSGEREARTAAELVAALGASLACVIDDGPVRGGVPSSVVAVDAAGTLEILREGALSRARLEAAV
jgi:L-threonylcarbamoyladenylate synthase